MFGTPDQESPWAWSSAVPIDEGGWSTPNTATRVALDEHHTATRDPLAMAEQLVSGAAEFSVTQHRPRTLPPDTHPLSAAGDSPAHATPQDWQDTPPIDAHQALLAVAGQATWVCSASPPGGVGHLAAILVAVEPIPAAALGHGSTAVGAAHRGGRDLPVRGRGVTVAAGPPTADRSPEA